ncbi:melanin-concentrating hormone receptor 1-like [Clytia hemisphaerica]|uniref:melanin-concentrating hormone receptor 1-like n=1 Tax=Clytia hemisphaerica TaxID=252671 RepID=UPI0034D42D59
MILFSFNMAFGIFGNTLVIYICGYKLKNKKYKIIKIIFLLAIVDLISSVANPSLFIYLIYFNYYEWHFGIVGCKFLKSIGPIATTVSCGLILFMAIDRYRAIVTPTKQQFQAKVIYSAALVILILAIVSHMPYMYFLQISGVECRVVDETELFYKIDVAIILCWDFTVLAIFIITAATIRRALVETTQKIERSLTGTQLKNVQKRDKRVNRLIIAVCLVFILCIFPRDILHVYFGVKTILQQKYQVTSFILNVNTVLKLLSTCNSTLNVLLYAKLNYRFQRELLQILVSKTCIGRIEKCQDLMTFYSSRSSDRRPSRGILIHQSTVESNI